MTTEGRHILMNIPVGEPLLQLLEALVGQDTSQVPTRNPGSHKQDL